MGCRGGCLLLLLVISCISARSLAAIDAAAAGEATETSPVHEVLCAICENFADKAMNYLADNKTQIGIINAFHKSCSGMPYLYRQSCITLMDYYLSILFEKVNSLRPELFCQSVNICGKNATVPVFSDAAACSECQSTASQMLAQLRDHDTKLQLMEAVLNGCDTMVEFGQQLKNMVMEYAPPVMSNAEYFIEKTHLCTNVCKAPQQVMAEPQLGAA